MSLDVLMRLDQISETGTFEFNKVKINIMILDLEEPIRYTVKKNHIFGYNFTFYI